MHCLYCAIRKWCCGQIYQKAWLWNSFVALFIRNLIYEHDFSEVCFIKISDKICYNESHACVKMHCVRTKWDVDHCGKLMGQVEAVTHNTQVLQMRRAAAGESGHTPGIAQFSVAHKTHSSIFWFCMTLPSYPCRTLRMSPIESGTVVSHVSVKHRIPQSLLSCWKVTLALRSYCLFFSYCTVSSRILGSGSRCTTSACFGCRHAPPPYLCSVPQASVTSIVVVRAS